MISRGSRSDIPANFGIVRISHQSLYYFSVSAVNNWRVVSTNVTSWGNTNRENRTIVVGDRRNRYPTGHIQLHSCDKSTVRYSWFPDTPEGTSRFEIETAMQPSSSLSSTTSGARYIYAQHYNTCNHIIFVYGLRFPWHVMKFRITCVRVLWPQHNILCLYIRIHWHTLRNTCIRSKQNCDSIILYYAGTWKQYASCTYYIKCVPTNWTETTRRWYYYKYNNIILSFTPKRVSTN